MVTRVPGYPCPAYHAVVQTQEREQTVYGNPGTRVPVYALPAAAQTLKREQIVYGKSGTRVCRDPGGVPGSGANSVW